MDYIMAKKETGIVSLSNLVYDVYIFNTFAGVEFSRFVAVVMQIRTI